MPGLQQSLHWSLHAGAAHRTSVRLTPQTQPDYEIAAIRCTVINRRISSDVNRLSCYLIDLIVMPFGPREWVEGGAEILKLGYTVVWSRYEKERKLLLAFYWGLSLWCLLWYGTMGRRSDTIGL